MKDNSFLRTKVPMTKEEIRAISIDKLQLKGKNNFLDIGSGTGSISVQSALSFPNINITSIDNSKKAIEITQRNILKFEVNNINLIYGTAPQNVPKRLYDAIFIGGSGSNLSEIIHFSIQHLTAKGRLVMNFILLENAIKAFHILNKKHLKDIEMIEARISKIKSLGPGHFLKPNNPTLIISGKKEA